MSSLISVIVPIYNVEKYLKKCVDSICKQTYKNLEIILIDDGSGDSSGTLCDEFARSDSRIKVIHKSNGGLSNARNCGINVSNGEYLTFIDGDDYIDSEMLEKLYNCMENDESDMALCSLKYVDENGLEIDIRKNDSPLQNEIISGMDALYKLAEDKSWYYSVACTKLYKRYIFDKIRFPEGKLHEDEFVIHHTFYKCNKISVINDKLYYYVQRNGSITNSKNKIIRFISSCEAMKDRAEFCLNINQNKLAYEALSSCVQSWVKIQSKDKEIMRIKKNLKCDYYKLSRYITTHDLDYMRKVIVFINRIFPSFLIMIKKVQKSLF